MEKVRQWTLIVSAVSVMSGILTSVLPKNMHKNYFKVISGIIIIYAVLQPLTGTNGIDFKMNDFLSDNYQVSNELDKYAVSAMVNSAEKAIEDILNEKAKEMSIECKFKCECYIRNDQMEVRKISVNPNVNPTEKKLIEDLCEDYGFNNSVVFFAGEEHE